MTLRDDIIECQCQIPALIDIYPKRFGDRPGYFVEAGAFDGLHWSNTYPLIKKGWGGLMFEPYPEFYEMCRERYRDNPLIEVEQCALTDYCGNIKLFPGGSMTTTAENLIDFLNGIDWVRALGLSHERFISCEAHTLDCRLAQHNVPPEFDLLSIDVEGAEDRVLMGLDLNLHRPRMIIIELDVESREPLIQQKVNWIQLHLKFSGYTPIHQDAINSIYWREA